MSKTARACSFLPSQVALTPNKRLMGCVFSEQESKQSPPPVGCLLLQISEKQIMSSIETLLLYTVLFLSTYSWTCHPALSLHPSCPVSWDLQGQSRERSLRLCWLVSPEITMMITFSLKAHIEIQIYCSFRGDTWSSSDWHPCFSLSPHPPQSNGASWWPDPFDMNKFSGKVLGDSKNSCIKR